MIKLYFKKRSSQIKRLIIVGTIFVAVIGLSFNLEQSLNPSTLSASFVEYAQPLEPAVTFTGLTTKISGILNIDLNFQDVYQNLQKEYDHNIFVSSGAYGFIPGTTISGYMISIIVLPNQQEFFNSLGIDNLGANDTIFISEKFDTPPEVELLLEGTDESIIPNVKVNVTRSVLKGISPLLDEVLFSFAHSVYIVSDAFFSLHSFEVIDVFGYTSFENSVYNQIIWDDKGYIQYECVTNAILKAFQNNGIAIDSFGGYIERTIESTQNERNGLMVIISYSKNVVIILAFLMFISYGRKVLEESKNIDTMYSFYGRRFVWHSLSECISVYITTLLFGMTSAYMGSKFIFELENLKLKFEFDAIPYVFILLSYITLYLLYLRNTLKMSAPRLAKFFKWILGIITIGMLVLLANIGLLSSAIVYVALSIALISHMLLQWVFKFSKKIISHFSGNKVIKRNKPWELISVGLKDFRLIKLFTIILVLSFILTAKVSSDNLGDLAFQGATWKKGGEIVATTTYGNISNIETFLSSIDEVLGFTDVISIQDEYFGTNDYLLHSKFTILGVDWMNAIEYFTSEKVNEWLKYDNYQLDNSSVIVSSEYEQIGVDLGEQFNILAKNDSGATASLTLNVANVFQVWPILTYSSGESFGKSIIMNIETLHDHLDFAGRNVEVQFLIRVDLDDMDEVALKLTENNYISTIETVSTQYLGRYLSFVQLGALTSILAFSILWFPMLLRYQNQYKSESRILAFISLNVDIRKHHKKYRIYESLSYFGYSMAVLLLIKLLLFIVREIMLRGVFFMENVQSPSENWVFLLPIFPMVLSAVDYYHLRHIDPVTVLRYKE